MQKLLLLFHILCSYVSYSSSAGVKLYVFGDSYADTGNWNTSVASAWKVPYGMTYPGKPAGRFSDGRILTDYFASYLEIDTPIPYEEWNLSKKGDEFGMNFAYGGTGVFDTDITRPNMTSQIDIFERIINQSQPPLNSSTSTSVALVSLGGNDYTNYLKHPSNLSVPEFTKTVIDQLVVNLERIHNLGVQKIAVTAMEPIGCIPAITFYLGYQSCTQTLNEVASNHNTLLQQNVDLLNNKTKDNHTFITLDLYAAFMSSLQPPPGESQNVNRLEPCCNGVASNYECGSVEGKVNKYTVCEKPGEAFFWDKVHPTQNGWNQVFKAIQPTLNSMLKAH